ncbi:toll/interleukin-1 receptor domain-containing protein [Mucilaginibacter gilvus]|uniref:Toll/interleukin-1 receptor domain-containing protein n=1 Tax=Mucilaginibacter gilvus TaxID=2305909 RepID=A0A3S3V034_9SPHI|nr:toll/interleukin-1 receptor domain-containing protein [Mucilaginibacter gilvus]RWY52328.1 toll/interleukin-1 receptor domain-containing protein [Mucilaginibacter gilvus]
MFDKVFISYSFKDKVFARKLNEGLRLRGVSTFLWENDAPGGKPLKKIMSENIQRYDTLLFIASENSIKSVACQYELTEGRKKQDVLWKTIYFPIHIDDFLFNVQKDDIRPRLMQEEFWMNIEEPKAINSTDFTSFNCTDIDEKLFQESINKLVKDLKK